MLLRAPKIPKYRHHKAKNLAVVTINGKHIYLGPHGSPESWQRYHQVVAEWLETGGETLPAPVPDEHAFFGVNCLVERYLIHARDYYKKDGRLTNEFKEYVYSQQLNTPFQGLAADGAKLALWMLWRAGYRIANFVHDEVLIEVPDNDNK